MSDEPHTPSGKLRRWLDLMEDAVQDTHASGRPAATLEGAWAGLKAELEMSERVDYRVELGCAGHLIVARYCRWKRHTQVGKYRISSIGDYYSPGAMRRGGDEKRTTIGAGDDAWFETMVFETVDRQDDGNEGCGCRHVKDWSEIDGERYATAGEAQAGHERFVAKYQDMK